MLEALRQQIEEDAIGEAELLASSLAAPVYFLDFSVIGDLLGATMSAPHVEFVHLEDLEGRIMHDGSLSLENYGATNSNDARRARVLAGERLVEVGEHLV